jgi:hypothetical protein
MTNPKNHGAIDSLSEGLLPMHARRPPRRDRARHAPGRPAHA